MTKIIVLLLALAAAAFGQAVPCTPSWDPLLGRLVCGSVPVRFQSVDPVGSCTIGVPNIQNTQTGFQFACLGTGTTGTWGMIAAVGSTGTLSYYLTNTASDISTYLQATTAPFTPKTTLTTANLAAGSTTITNWSTNAGFPGLTFIPAGIFLQHIHALRTGVPGSVVLRAQIWEVSNVGADIAMIGVTEDSAPLTTAEQEYSLEFASTNVYTMQSSASRIVSRVIAVVVGGSTPNLSIFVGGTADSRIALPSNTVDATNFVPYSGAVSDVALGTKNLTANGHLSSGTFPTITGCGVISSTAGGATAGTFATNTTGACTAVIPMPTAPHGWTCYVQNLTKHVATNIMIQSASATNSCTVTGTTASGDVLNFMAIGW